MNEQYLITSATPPKEARNWAMICHLTGFAGYLFPFGNLIVPLAVWLIKRDQMPYLDDQGKEAVNFQITMLIAYAVAFALILILVGFLLFPPLFIYHVVMMVVAAIKANEGAEFRYPFTIRLLK